MRTKASFLIPVLLLLLVFIPGCDDENDNDRDGTPDAFTPFSVEAAVTGNADAGVLQAWFGPAGVRTPATSLLAAATQEATGEFWPIFHAPVDLTGTYDPATGAFTLAGGGFTFTGTFANGRVTGTFTGPEGEGHFAGLEGVDEVTVYCGTFTGEDDSGAWILAASGTTVVGSFSGSSMEGGLLEGTISGSTIDLVVPNTTVTATGHFEGNAVGGTWDDGQGDGGTWEGSSAACSD